GAVRRPGRRGHPELRTEPQGHLSGGQGSGRRCADGDRVKRLAAALGLMLVLAGCASEVPLPTFDDPAPAVERAEVGAPELIEIPALGVSSDLIPLWLEPTGELQAPPIDQPMQAGWYAGGVKPGEVGPAVIAAHVNAHGRPGRFKDLHTLAEGEMVFVDDLTFIVDKVEKYPKDQFPTLKVYGNTKGPELRLITCGGDFDPATGHYEDNIVVYASVSE